MEVIGLDLNLANLSTKKYVEGRNRFTHRERVRGSSAALAETFAKCTAVRDTDNGHRPVRRAASYEDEE